MEKKKTIAELKEERLLSTILDLETKLFVAKAMFDKINEKVAFYSSLPVESEADKGFFQAFEIMKNILGGGL